MRNLPPDHRRPAIEGHSGSDKHRTDRGSIMVEAALIMMAFVVLVFGVIEWSLVLRDMAATSSGVRVGVRTASIPPGVGATDITKPAADAIQKWSSVMPKDYIDFILVYQANTDGFPLPEGNATMTCAGAGATCVKYRWNDTRDQFVKDATTSWNPALINTCVGSPDAQSVGVFMQATHPMTTRFFGASRVISDSAVLRFEPRPNSVANGGSPCT